MFEFVTVALDTFVQKNRQPNQWRSRRGVQGAPGRGHSAPGAMYRAGEDKEEGGRKKEEDKRRKRRGKRRWKLKEGIIGRVPKRDQSMQQ